MILKFSLILLLFDLSGRVLPNQTLQFFFIWILLLHLINLMSFSTTYINQPNYFGTQMADPRFAGQTTFSWTVNVNTTMPFITPAEDQKIALEIVGIPPVAPIAGQEFKLAVIFKRTAERLPTPLVDGIWVSWNVGNGPNATVTVQDTYSYTGFTMTDLQAQDTL